MEDGRADLGELYGPGATFAENLAAVEKLMYALRWEEARLLAERLVLTNPTNPRLHGYIGMCLFREGKLEVAVVSFRRAIALDHKFWEAGTKLAQCLLQMKNNEEAHKVAQEWLVVRPNDSSLRGMVEFLKPHVRGEKQRWEMNQRVESRIILTSDEDER